LNEDQVLPRLSLASLPLACPRLTAVAGEYMADAAALSLENQGHRIQTILVIRGVLDRGYMLEMIPVTDQMRASYDMDEAVEQGACAIAILTLCDYTGMTVIRARKGTGIDYWLGFDSGDLPFQSAARLEVSGILNSDDSRINTRLREKLEQTRASDGPLPAYVCIVEFSRPILELAVR